MKLYRILAAACFLGGMTCLIIGMEQSGQAQCNETYHESKICVPAHATEPVQSASMSYCEWVDNVCQAASGTSCTDRWGSGHEGDCFPQILGTDEDKYNCYEDSFQTFVTIPWYTAECVQDNAECNCKWTETMTTQSMTLCDCYDIEAL